MHVLLVSDHLHGQGHDVLFCSGGNVGYTTLAANAYDSPGCVHAMTLFSNAGSERASINNGCNVRTNTAHGTMHVSCYDACLREGVTWKPRSCTAKRERLLHVWCQPQHNTPTRSNNCRRCLRTRPRSLNYALLTLQSSLAAHAVLSWTHRAAEP